MQDAANARTADKLATIEQGVAQIGRRLLGLSQQFLTGVQVARILGKDGEAVWIRYDRDYIAGEFDFEVVGGSTMPNNESARRAQAADMVNALAPFASAGILDMGKLAAYVLQTGFGIKNPEAFLSTPQAPAPESQAPSGPPPVSAETMPMLPQGGMPPEGGLPPELMALLAGGGAPPTGGMPPEMGAMPPMGM
jgi:hypothetical protein